MMMLSEIAKALNTNVIGEDVNVLSVGTDSRTIKAGQLFVALKGEHFNGNTYAADAIARGAAAVVVSDADVEASPAVLVSDTKVALGELAHYWRQKFSLPIVAVTGSNGKTTVKEMLASILNVASGVVLATKGNFNNNIGMPLTLLNMRAEHEYAVIEMGMNHEGEIRYLTNIAQPQVAVINNAGTAHIGELGSREAIAQAKGEIFEGLSEGGIAVINVDDDFGPYWQSLNVERKVISFGLEATGLSATADVSATFETQATHTAVKLKTPSGTVAFNLNVLGKHNVSNALAASAVAVALGFDNEVIAAGLAQFNGVQWRLQQHVGYQDAVVIDDTYNANPDSMKAAIDVLVNQHDASHTIFVMGDMAELGSDAGVMHAAIGQYAGQQGVSKLLSFGQLSQLGSGAFGKQGQHFQALDALVSAVKKEMHAGTCVLVKGSRSMKMERVVEAIVKDKKLARTH
ncbi:MAG: UDP-N-acetylmuramoyl-tripeptide--D-alanyl-D-alanine ligase [Methylophilaceae bacterium]|jgi:UDP-N-acetylmuramoyl-tripeptide--D-alanyl-D-alanine ligase|tara:strand:+ start:26767 stop:28146 length:1380 start_codon:yes stop_codon:yes gene_type:complete